MIRDTEKEKLKKKKKFTIEKIENIQKKDKNLDTSRKNEERKNIRKDI